MSGLTTHSGAYHSRTFTLPLKGPQSSLSLAAEMGRGLGLGNEYCFACFRKMGWLTGWQMMLGDWCGVGENAS